MQFGGMHFAGISKVRANPDAQLKVNASNLWE